LIRKPHLLQERKRLRKTNRERLGSSRSPLAGDEVAAPARTVESIADLKANHGGTVLIWSSM